MTALFTGHGALEGPVFRHGELWCVVMDGGCLLRVHDGTITRVPVGGAPNGMTLGSDGCLYICDNRRQAILRYDPDRDRLELLCESIAGRPCRKTNDCAFDAAGNLVFTCPQWPEQDPDPGFVGYLRPDGSTGLFAEGEHFWNGLAFADEGRTLYVSDSSGRGLWRGGWDAQECRWLDPQPLVTLERGCPDGMAIDRSGVVHLAVYTRGEVRRIRPDGSELPPLRTAGKRTTNCAFDPADPTRLVITEMERGELSEVRLAQPGVDLFLGRIDTAGAVIESEQRTATRETGASS